MTNSSENNDIIECPSCGSPHSTTELCDCGYEASLEDSEKRDGYTAIHALTATLDLIGKGNEIKFESTIGQEWSLLSDDVIQFITRTDKKFMSKRKSHGFIKKDNMPLNTPSIFLKYLNDSLGFSDFVISIMRQMKREANSDKSKIVGGAFVFIHYQVDQDKYSDGRLLILMVDRKGEFDFNQDLIPKKIPSIDTNALRQAVLIDMTLFKAGYPENECEPYLHFITGKSRSEFFKRALGCDSKVDNNRSVSQAIAAVDDFIINQKITIVDKIKVNDSIELLFNEKSKNSIDRKVTIEDIGNCIEKTLPRRRGVANKFTKFVDNNGYMIDDYFEPSIFSGKSVSKVKIIDDEKDYEFIFDVSSLSEDEDSDAKIIYKRQDGQIIIRLARSGSDEMQKKIPSK
ncbi:nucleoid-associated protein [Morganella morganii]|uniref:nucleoid-associated protein n=1 Tax=Morganella morganii TaxID=582 RepID=UPI003EB6CA4F